MRPAPFSNGSTSTKPTLLFAGTPDFAAASLAALIGSGQRPEAVLTQPDRPSGRGRKLTASPVKLLAQAHEIRVWQPATLRDESAVQRIADLKPDLLVVAAYGLILPPAVLDIPRRGCLNIHASLLPRWRGAAPIQHAILAGDDKSGVCLMDMEAGLDTGGVYASLATDIDEQDTAATLHDRLSKMGAELLVQELANVLDGSLDLVPQDDAQATYAGKIRTADAQLNWSADAHTVHRTIRAYNPVPGAWFEFGKERIKCWEAEIVDGDDAHASGDVLPGRPLQIACGDGRRAINLQTVQRPGRRRVTGEELNAQLDLAGMNLNTKRKN